MSTTLTETTTQHGNSLGRTDNEQEFKRLTQRVSFAWPTVLLLILAFTTFISASALYLTDQIPLALMIFLNSMASFWAFTVGHDASHNAITTNKKVNDWVGRISILLLSPIPFFRMFRFIHMQHHRFSNDPDKDPDYYCGKGSKWTLPLRWATLDLHYFTIYLRPSIFKKRPKDERKELFIALVWAATLVTAIISAGWGLEYLLIFLIPARIATIMLAFAFDFLPHYPHDFKSTEQPYKATLNRVGMEWLLTPLLLSQNYHLVHHLYPTVPFYRYIAVWRAKENFHLSNDPAQTSAFGLGPQK